MTITHANPEQWVEEHGDFLFRYALVRVKDQSLAEDMVQDALLAAWKSRERYDPKHPERAWLVGILRHKIIDHIRKASRTVLVDQQEFADIENSPVFKAFGIAELNPPRWKFSPRKALEQKEFWDVFSRCLTKLDKLMHTTFVLKELEGQSTEEICKELDITPNYVWVLLHRARNQLKTCLETNWIARTGDRT